MLRFIAGLHAKSVIPFNTENDVSMTFSRSRFQAQSPEKTSTNSRKRHAHTQTPHFETSCRSPINRENWMTLVLKNPEKSAIFSRKVSSIFATRKSALKSGVD